MSCRAGKGSEVALPRTTGSWGTWSDLYYQHLKTQGPQRGLEARVLSLQTAQQRPELQSWRLSRGGKESPGPERRRPPSASTQLGSRCLRPHPEAVSHHWPRVGRAGKDTRFPCSLSKLALSGQKAQNAAGKCGREALGRQMPVRGAWNWFWRGGVWPRAAGKPCQSVSLRLEFRGGVFLGPQPQRLWK